MNQNNQNVPRVAGTTAAEEASSPVPYCFFGLGNCAAASSIFFRALTKRLSRLIKNVLACSVSTLTASCCCFER